MRATNDNLPDNYTNQVANTPELVRIFDTTLRDGEQSPDVALNVDEKLQIAEQLARLGVDVIEAGFPASSPGDMSAVQQIAIHIGRSKRTSKHGSIVEPPGVAAMARANHADIESAWRGIRDSRYPRLHVVLATSDIHMAYKLRKTRAEVLDMARIAVTHARSLCNDVEFSPEDATRSDREFLVQVLEVAVAAGATTLNIPDTVGYALPEEFGSLIRFLHQRFATANGVVVSVHCHNDLGLATANTLAGLANGGRQIEVTINGIGERAGNACMAETVMALHTRPAMFNLETNIITREICETSKLVSGLTGMLVQPNKAIVGANAFAHQSGIHQDGVLKNRRTYEIMDASVVGAGESRLVLGKLSGRNALRSKLEKLGYCIEGEKLDLAFKRMKEVLDTERSVSDAQLHEICGHLAVPVTVLQEVSFEEDGVRS
jgi:2-isopropylmalate synthase